MRFSLLLAGGACSLSLLTACVSTPPPSRMWFKLPGISTAQWERIDAECSYEAEKATASADPSTPTLYRWRRLFIMCAELKGASYVGVVRMEAEKLDPIVSACKKEAAGAPLKGSTPHARNEEREEHEFACMKREGVRFEREAWL